MMYYIKRQSYPDAKKALQLINAHIAQQIDNKQLSLLVRAQWKEVYATLGAQSVSVSVSQDIQAYELNVVLEYNDLEIMITELPYLLQNSSENNDYETMLSLLMLPKLLKRSNTN